jgi:hypothetical protein
MEGPITKTQQSVNWESRASQKSPTSPNVQRKLEGLSHSETSSITVTQPGELHSTPANEQPLFSPSENKFAASPAPVTPGEAFKLQLVAGTPSLKPPRPDGLLSAPAELGEAHKQLTIPVDQSESPDLRRHTGAAVIMTGAEPFELDESAPQRAARESSAFGPSKQQKSHTDEDGIVRRDTALTTDELERARGLSGDMPLRPIRELLSPTEASSSATPVGDDEKVEGWGKPFKIKWIRTEKLPFHRTRHLRNPWNSDREVKVSRDGTEVEPSIGQRLVDEWDRAVESEPAAAVPSAARHVLPSRPGAHSTYQQSKTSPPRGQQSRQL